MTAAQRVADIPANLALPARRRRPWVAAVLTFLLSGLGQLYAGRARRGVLIFLFTIAAAGAFLLTWMGHPTFRLMALGFVLVLGVKVGLMIDAARVARVAPVPFALKAYNRWYIYAAVWLLADFLVFPQFKGALTRHGLEAFRLPAGAASMEPSWMAGDYIMVAPIRQPPTRGQVVVYRMSDVTLLKRVVGIPGDTIAMSNGQLSVNGVKVSEPYARLADSSAASAVPLDSTDFYWQNRYLVSGVTADSYRPTLKNWGPLVMPDSDYFVLGDNRDVGVDSRLRGFVPATAMLARPLFIYWSWDAGRRSTRWGRIGLTPQ